MMDTAKDFEEVRASMLRQVDKEIMGLKHYLENLNEEDLVNNPDGTGEACEKIVYASEGLKKLSTILNFIDCWEENGDIPQLSQKVSFEKEDD